MSMDDLHEHLFEGTVVDGLVVDSQCVCGTRPIDLFDEAVIVAEPEIADPNPLGVDIDIAEATITGGEGHGSGDARQLLVIQPLTNRDNLKPAERIRLLDSDIREAMALAARRLDAEAMKYSVQGFTWWLEDIHYDMGAKRTIVASLRIARNGA